MLVDPVVQVPADALDEARRFNDAVEQMLAGTPSVHTVAPAESRAARREGRGTFPAPEMLEGFADRAVPGRAGDVPVRVHVPEGAVGAYLHIHGGGWVLGDHDMQDLALQALAQRARVAVASVGYRLAPEHPWPAGPDDCEDAALWFVRDLAPELGLERLVIGGESAGAHLAAVTLLRLRDHHGLTPFAGANLVYGCFDLGRTPSVRRWGERNLVLSGPIVEWFLECLTPGLSDEERRDPAISPLYADLAGLPPALFTVGDTDMLLDDSLFMAARWKAAGNQTDLRVYPEGIHGFNAFPTALARQCNQDQWDFVAAAVGAPGAAARSA